MRKQQDSTALPVTGQVFDFPYPFVRATFTEFDEGGSAELPTWSPGIRMELGPPDGGDGEPVADAMGAQIVTVHGIFKPGKFPLRVFFTRKWRDPDGKEFGKGGCRVMTIGVFRNLVRGYRHEFDMVGEPRKPRGRRSALADLCRVMEVSVATTILDGARSFNADEVGK